MRQGQKARAWKRRCGATAMSVQVKVGHDVTATYVWHGNVASRSRRDYKLVVHDAESEVVDALVRHCVVAMRSRCRKCGV